LLHRREAHAELERLGLLSRSTAEGAFLIPRSMPRISRHICHLLADLTGSLMVFSPSATYPTARLVWATPVPKGRWSTFPRTRHASKVTPSAVNSRPSVCLSSYLLQGRNVMLEINVAKGDAEPGAPSVKKTAHTLISHGGHIYIHANDISPHKLLDSQDTRETMKLKRATNARVADFTSLIKETTLRLPNDSEKSYDTQADVLCVQPRRLLLRITRYWPIRSDQSLIYNMSKRFDAFFATIRQPLLTALDADKCKQRACTAANISALCLLSCTNGTPAWKAYGEQPANLRVERRRRYVGCRHLIAKCPKSLGALRRVDRETDVQPRHTTDGVLPADLATFSASIFLRWHVWSVDHGAEPVVEFAADADAGSFGAMKHIRNLLAYRSLPAHTPVESLTSWLW
uniref:Protein asunder n=1 Tax=Heligmosomoides polygyrus TaxID=6339 RepID=A0A183F406_HELPZ